MLFFSEGNNERGNGVELYSNTEADFQFTAGGSVITESGGATFLHGADGVNFDAEFDITIESNVNVTFTGEGEPHASNDDDVFDEVGVLVRTLGDGAGVADDIQFTSQSEMLVRSANDFIAHATSLLEFTAGGAVELFAEHDVFVESTEDFVRMDALTGDIDINPSGDTYLRSGNNIEIASVSGDLLVRSNSERGDSFAHMRMETTGGDIEIQATNGVVHLDAPHVEIAATAQAIFPHSDDDYGGAACGVGIPDRAFWINSARGFCFCRSLEVVCLSIP